MQFLRLKCKYTSNLPSFQKNWIKTQEGPEAKVKKKADEIKSK